MNEFVGIFKSHEVINGNIQTYYTFRAISDGDYETVVEGEPACPDCFPEAAFIVSKTPFEGADKIKWQLKGQTQYANRVVINDEMATEITPDVVSDMIVEDAIMKEVEVLRIKIEKYSAVSTSLQESNMPVVMSDNDYTYFEIDIPKEAALRDEMYNNQE